ncbi:MAG: glutamate racemase [Patescibacteria group bacterium]
MIGVFDSGLGGLGVFRKIKLFLPYEDIYYYADSANAPYGGKTKKQLQKLALNAILKLEKAGCNIIVVACNTATTAGIDYFRKHSKAYIIGVVPVIKTAVKMTENNKIALLATPFTVKSQYTANLIKKFANNKKISKIACPTWVKAIENDKITDKIITNCTQNIKDEDVVILGCTHFSLIKGRIQRAVGPDKMVISSNDAVARHVMRIGLKYKLLHKKPRQPKYTFQCSGDKAIFKSQIKKYLK